MMAEVLLLIMTLGMFGFGFYVIGRFGRFMDSNYGGFYDPKEEESPEAEAPEPQKKTFRTQRVEKSRNRRRFVV